MSGDRVSPSFDVLELHALANAFSKRRGTYARQLYLGPLASNCSRPLLSPRSVLMPIRVCAPVVVLVLALASLGWPRSAFGQDKSAEGGAFRSEVDLVSVYFTVRDDKKRLVSDLAQDSFSVSEDGHPQAIKFFAHHSDVVLDVGVLLDTGSNMSWI